MTLGDDGRAKTLNGSGEPSNWVNGDCTDVSYVVVDIA